MHNFHVCYFVVLASCIIQIGLFHFPYCLIRIFVFVFSVPITDEELLTLSKNLHINDVNGVIVELDLQAKTTIGDLTDKAPGR